MATVFWRDMVIIGTALNVVSALGGMILLAAGAPTALVMTVYFAPLPWNLFLFIAVWKSTEKAEPSDALIVRIVAAVWFVLVAIL